MDPVNVNTRPARTVPSAADRYTTPEGRVCPIGMRALVRLPPQQQQRARDVATGWTMGDSICGHPGPPMGRCDMALGADWAQAPVSPTRARAA